MAGPALPIFFLLMAGKVIFVNYGLYQKLKERVVVRQSVIGAIDEQIPALREALPGPAGKFAQAEIDRLNELRQVITHLPDSFTATAEEYSLWIMKNANAAQEATKDTLQELQITIDGLTAAMRQDLANFRNRVATAIKSAADVLGTEPVEK